MTQTKEQLYTKLIRKYQDQHGFIATEHCDSLLFSSLLSCHPQFKINYFACLDDRGFWHRRPNKDCFESGGSKSTISRDMLLGLLFGAFFNQRLDIIEQVIDSTIDNNLIMGKAESFKDLMGRCFMTPSLLGTYAKAARALGSKKYYFLSKLPAMISTTQTGFQAHLAILHIMLLMKIEPHKNHQKKAMIYADAHDHNPLFLIAAGRKQEALKIMNDERLWPKDRLPTNKDRHSPYLLERDWGTDWLPTDYSNTTKEHNGADYLFLCWAYSKF